MRTRVVAVLLVACGGLVGAAPIASAQVPLYPPTILPSVCLSLSGDTQPSGGITLVLFEGTITISGPAGCATEAETVDVSAASNPVSLGSTTANPDGSYSLTATLPASITPGQHEIIADFGPGRAQVVRPILVVTSFGAGGVAAAANGPNLPRTGADIVGLVIWAMALLTVGAALILYRRHRSGQLVPADTVPRLRLKLPRTPPKAAAERLQRADTTRFVPEKAERRRPSKHEQSWPYFTPPES